MVKCIDCGYLAARHHETRLLEEVEEDYRNSGVSPNTTVGYKHGIGIAVYDEPICFMRSCDLKAEYGEKRPGVSKDLLSTLRKDRECSSFTDWQQGFTPKEHREMMDREGMKKWQMEREEADKKWRMEQEEKRSKDEWKRYRFLGVMTIVAAICGVLAGHFL
jgi:hypothetical protein